MDASSSASLAAYLNTLTYALGEGRYSGKVAGWRINTGVYCCYNAFSRVDMRVEVKFPGKTETYLVDDRGGKKENPSNQMWLETYLCSILRAILYSDDTSYNLSGWRKLDPLADADLEQKFLDAAEQLFDSGWQLGSNPEVQVATSVTNHLTTALLQYFKTNGRFTSAINLFEKLRSRESEVDVLLARTYLDMDEEIKAVTLLTDSLLQNPLNHSLLDVEIQFLQAKSRHDLALESAKRAVNCAPSEFVAWARLTEIYIGVDDYEKALLTLNSCPMFTYYERDNHRMPSAKLARLPIPPDSTTEEILNEIDMKNGEADQALVRLPAPGLRGTFAKAYELLTKLVAKVGWDDLLKFRSAVFVMEEEYRTQKAPAADAQPNGMDGGPSKPETIHATETSSEGTENAKLFPFQHKRLCERWLDNLFMVLYEDLRVYTIWTAEMSHFKNQNLGYRKTALEWEILGELAWRMHHKEEAEEAFSAAIELQFSPKSWIKLAEIWQSRGDNDRALTAIVKLTAYNHRWYSEVCLACDVPQPTDVL